MWLTFSDRLRIVLIILTKKLYNFAGKWCIDYGFQLKYLYLKRSISAVVGVALSWMEVFSLKQDNGIELLLLQKEVNDEKLYFPNYHCFIFSWLHR